jgi:MoxR-like ATPase
MSQPVRNLKPAFDRKASPSIMAKIARNLEQVVRGKPRQAELAVTCLVGRGHLLLEDVPGVGKTTLAEAIAISCALNFARIQFTADLLPADILGAQIFHPATATFEFRRGPLFHQLVLADELNRAPPRTQSALLEAMAHGQVSIDGSSFSLPQPFCVIATQNPTDFSGTYPLPDSQLDRFLMRVSLGHPSPEVESEILRTRGSQEPLRGIRAVISAEDVLALQQCASEVRIESEVADYAVRLVSATRQHPEVERGASTRAALALVAAAKAHALWEDRDFATPADLRAVLVPTLAHRLLLKSAIHGTFSREESGYLVEEMAKNTPAPR